MSLPNDDVRLTQGELTSDQKVSAWFSDCIRSHNKTRLLGMLQSGRNPNKTPTNFNANSVLVNDQPKLKQLEPYLLNGVLPSTSILHEAIIFNDEDIINILLNFGSKINEFCGIDRRGLSCLMLAVIFGHNNLLDLLVKRGCNYSLFNDDTRTALDLAIVVGNVEAVNFLAPFKRYFYYLNPKRSKLTVSEYLTTYSKPSSCLQIIERMVTIGYDLGETPGVSILLDLFSSSNLLTSNATTAIKSFIDHYESLNQINLLNERVNKYGCILHVMAQQCKSRAVQILIELGSDVNAGNDESDTPMHIVLREPVTSQAVQAMEILLEAGADLFRSNKNKISPLEVALEFSQVHSIIAKHISSQAHVISTESKVHEILSDPSVRPNPYILQFLRSRKVTFHSLNLNHQSPLHCLLQTHGSLTSSDTLVQCVNVLLENDEILDIVDNEGMNVAMIALSQNVIPSIVMRLISSPLCTQYVNPRGQDVLSMIINSNYRVASDEEKLSLCQLAVKKGALVNNPSRFGCESFIASCKEAKLSSQGIPKFLFSVGFKPLREDIDCISRWSLSLLELTLEHCNATIIRTQFPNILITAISAFIPRITDSRSPGVNCLHRIVRKLVQAFNVDVNCTVGGKHVLHLLIELKEAHKYPVCPLIKEILSGPQNVDLNVGYGTDTGTPLTHALKMGSYSIAEILIKSMSDFSRTEIRKMTLKFGFSGILKTLCKKGIKIDSKFFEKGFGQQDMGIIEEMNWLKSYLKSVDRGRIDPDSTTTKTKRIKSESSWD